MPHFHLRGPVVFVALVLFGCAALFVFTEEASAPSVGLKPEVSQDTAYTQEAYKNRRMDLQTYLDLNISKLSPVQEVLGGKFYVVDVKAANGKGVVTYEDGHNQYIADFSYTENDQTRYTVTKFRVR